MSAISGSVGTILHPVLAGILALAGMSQLAAINGDVLAAPSATRTAPRDDLQSRLAQAPYDQAALRGLASAARQRGNEASAHALIALSGQLGWRDSATELMLMEDAARRRDDNAAMRHIDALLRRKPDLAPMLMPALHAAAVSESGRNALLARLDENPPWRTDFFTRIDFIPAGYENAHETLLLQLARSGKPAADSEIVPCITALARAGSVTRARRLWITLSGAKDEQVLDPDFARFDPARSAVNPNPFEWTSNHLSGVELRVTIGAGLPSTRELVVDTDGSAYGTVLAQILVLPRGRYRLFVTAPSTDVLAYGGLAWMVRCLPGGKIVSADGSAAAAGWQADFAIPQEGCTAQRLSLEARRADTRAAGEARFEKVRVETLGRVEEPIS